MTCTQYLPTERKAACICGFLTLLTALPVCAQSPPQDKALVFDVASVRTADTSTLRAIQISPQRSGGRISWTTFLNIVLAYGERLQTWQISGPIPQDVFVFQVETMPEATDEQVRQMFRALLADRFKMTAHRVTKDLDGFALTIAKNGLKIKEAKEGAAPPPMPEWFAQMQPTFLDGKVTTTVEGRGVGALTGRRVTMGDLARALGQAMRASVADETGLTGKYYFGVKFAPERDQADSDLPPLAMAIQDLGLRLEKRRGPVDLLVVDRMEKTPSEN
jgi:uncharacterized protein (TIGR03435 family)